MNSSIELLGIVTSKNNIPIRLTKERWRHITTAHPEIDIAEYSETLNIVRDPDMILEGDSDELLAVKKTRKKMWFVVVYKEIDKKDGFILTAYITTDEHWLFKRKELWNKI
jgi:hypothetical protein